MWQIPDVAFAFLYATVLSLLLKHRNTGKNPKKNIDKNLQLAQV